MTTIRINAVPSYRRRLEASGFARDDAADLNVPDEVRAWLDGLDADVAQRIIDVLRDAKTATPTPEQSPEAVAAIKQTAAVTVAALRVATELARTRKRTSNSGLSQREIEKCKARGVDPAKYAETKAAMAGRR